MEKNAEMQVFVLFLEKPRCGIQGDIYIFDFISKRLISQLDQLLFLNSPLQVVHYLYDLLVYIFLFSLFKQSTKYFCQI